MSFREINVLEVCGWKEEGTTEVSDLGGEEKFGEAMAKELWLPCKKKETEKEIETKKRRRKLCIIISTYTKRRAFIETESNWISYSVMLSTSGKRITAYIY